MCQLVLFSRILDRCYAHYFEACFTFQPLLRSNGFRYHEVWQLNNVRFTCFACSTPLIEYGILKKLYNVLDRYKLFQNPILFSLYHNAWNLDAVIVITL